MRKIVISGACALLLCYSAYAQERQSIFNAVRDLAGTMTQRQSNNGSRPDTEQANQANDVNPSSAQSDPSPGASVSTQIFLDTDGHRQALKATVNDPDKTFFGVQLGSKLDGCIPMKKCMWNGSVGLKGELAGRTVYYIQLSISNDKSPVWIKQGFSFEALMFEDATIQAIRFNLPIDRSMADPKQVQLVYSKMIERLGQENEKFPISREKLPRNAPVAQFTAQWNKDWGSVRFSTWDFDATSQTVTVYVQSNEFAKALALGRKENERRATERDASRTKF